MAIVYGETPIDVVIEVAKSLGWFRSVETVLGNDGSRMWTDLHCQFPSGRKLELTLFTFSIDFEAPCGDIVPDLETGNKWNRIYGGPMFVCRDITVMKLKQGMWLPGGVTRENIRSNFLSMEYDLEHGLPENAH